jgi:hypothetical protein
MVADQLLAFHAEVGDFGTLLYAGHDWRDPVLARRSMVLMAEQVMPRVNAALHQDARQSTIARADVSSQWSRKERAAAP